MSTTYDMAVCETTNQHIMSRTYLCQQHKVCNNNQLTKRDLAEHNFANNIWPSVKNNKLTNRGIYNFVNNIRLFVKQQTHKALKI